MGSEKFTAGFFNKYCHTTMSMFWWMHSWISLHIQQFLLCFTFQWYFWSVLEIRAQHWGGLWKFKNSTSCEVVLLIAQCSKAFSVVSTFFPLPSNKGYTL